MKPALFILLLLCGCASPSRMREASMDVQYAAPPSLPDPYWLVWENYNSRNEYPLLRCEIHSTTNLTQPFKLWASVDAWATNAVAFYPTNEQEFFKAQFFDPQRGIYSGWNVK